MIHTYQCPSSEEKVKTHSTLIDMKRVEKNKISFWNLYASLKFSRVLCVLCADRCRIILLNCVFSNFSSKQIRNTCLWSSCWIWDRLAVLTEDTSVPRGGAIKTALTNHSKGWRCASTRQQTQRVSHCSAGLRWANRTALGLRGTHIGPVLPCRSLYMLNAVTSDRGRKNTFSLNL